MSLFANALRPFWLPRLNNAVGRPEKDLGGWICDEEFQVYSPVESNMFVLHVDNSGPLLKAYATGINRIAIAAFETVSNINQSAYFRSPLPGS
jgi:hypothetical protein